MKPDRRIGFVTIGNLFGWLMNLDMKFHNRLIDCGYIRQINKISATPVTPLIPFIKK